MKKNKDFDYRKAAADLDGAGAHDPDEIYEYRSEKAIRSYMSEHGLRADKYFKQDKKGADTRKSNDGCYLTTACVESRGLPDDCGELETLRAFRDTYLASQPNGKEEIAAYYRMAPGIVSAINALENRETIWNQVYAELVEPCVALIHDRQEDSAYRLYKAMPYSLNSLSALTFRYRVSTWESIAVSGKRA